MISFLLESLCFTWFLCLICRGLLSPRFFFLWWPRACRMRLMLNMRHVIVWFNRSIVVTSLRIHVFFRIGYRAIDFIQSMSSHSQKQQTKTTLAHRTDVGRDIVKRMIPLITKSFLFHQIIVTFSLTVPIAQNTIIFAYSNLERLPFSLRNKKKIIQQQQNTDNPRARWEMRTNCKTIMTHFVRVRQCRCKDSKSRA